MFRFLEAVFRIRNRRQDRVKPVVVGIKSLRRIQKWLCLSRMTEIYPRLRRAQIQSDVSFGRIREARVEFGALLLLTGEAVGVSQFGLYISCLVWDVFQRRDRLTILALIAERSSDRSQNFGISRPQALGTI